MNPWDPRYGIYSLTFNHKINQHVGKYILDAYGYILFVLIHGDFTCVARFFFRVRRYGVWSVSFPILESIPSQRPVTPSHLPLQSSIGAIPLDTTMSRCQNFSSRFICLWYFVHLWWDLCWHGYNAVGELGCLDGILEMTTRCIQVEKTLRCNFLCISLCLFHCH